jgi:TolA-binding protein
MPSLSWQCVYDFFRDQGAILAGILALVAGFIAFKGAIRAAEKQVAAVLEQKNQAHDDALAQIQALERQIDQRNREITDIRRREKVEIVRALATESARLDRLARDRLQVAEGLYSDRQDFPFG